MGTQHPTNPLPRRAVLGAVAAGVAGNALAGRRSFAESDYTRAAEDALVARMVGGPAALSPRVRLIMPASFSNGYSVPLALSVDSPMTGSDYVRTVHILAPKNPIVLAADFTFTPQSGRAALDTRIRLAQPQTVLAVAEMNDGTRLMARTWVEVDTDGCN